MNRPVADLTDEELFSSFRDSDNRESLGELFRRHADIAVRIAGRYMATPDQAEDAVQSAFLNVIEKRGQFKGQGSVRTWIMSIVINNCRSRNRNEARLRKRHEQAVSWPEENEAQEDSSGLQAAVREAMDELPLKYRMPVMMRYMEKFSYGEIAQALSIKDTLARMQVSRGLKLLRSQLAASNMHFSAAAIIAALGVPTVEVASPALLKSLTALAESGRIATASERIATVSVPVAATGTMKSLLVATGSLISIALAGMAVLSYSNSPEPTPGTAAVTPTAAPERAATKGTVLEIINGKIHLLRNEKILDGTPEAETALQPGEGVQTAKDSFARIRLADGTRVSVNQNTTLTLNQRRILLKQGELFIERMPEKESKGLTINTATGARVEAQKGDFEVAVWKKAGKDAVRLRVLNGSARLFSEKEQAVKVNSLAESKGLPGRSPLTPKAIKAAAIAFWRHYVLSDIVYFDNFDSDRGVYQITDDDTATFTHVTIHRNGQPATCLYLKSTSGHKLVTLMAKVVHSSAAGFIIEHDGMHPFNGFLELRKSKIPLKKNVWHRWQTICRFSRVNGRDMVEIANFANDQLSSYEKRPVYPDDKKDELKQTEVPYLDAPARSDFNTIQLLPKYIDNFRIRTLRKDPFYSEKQNIEGANNE